MFKCDFCNITTLPKISQRKVVVETREKVYPYLDGEGMEQVSRGREIVREGNACPSCFEENEIERMELLSTTIH